MITRSWAMPNKNTFEIKPINQLIKKYHSMDRLWIDPFARTNTFTCISNDLDVSFNTDHNVESLKFMKMFEPMSVDGVFFDPPYSPRQIKEVYNGIGRKVQKEDTQSQFWSERKNAIAEVLKVGGLCMSFGWNSNGIGLSRGFELVEVLIVAHGGMHNDTIVTVERKTQHQLKLNFEDEHE